MTLILASKSPIRQQMLRQAGISFIVKTAPLDEEGWKQDKDQQPRLIAKQLASEKSRQVSHLEPEAYIIGADQTLGFDEKLYNKPRSLVEAKQQLQQLRGKTHELYSGVSCHLGGQEIWSCCEKASLTMRNFSDDFLDIYLKQQGEDVLTSVGGYKLEHEGIQLFERIEGDYFTILGLPLLPLLCFLRQKSLIPS